MGSERSADMTASTPSPVLQRPGAVEADGADSGVAWHYGDPAAEQRALTDGRAVADQSHLGIVTVTGPDRLSWLDTLTTQAVGSLAPGASAEFMILTPQGRVEHVAGIVDDGKTAWLVTETAPALAAYLNQMRFMLRVEVTDATADWAALGEAIGTGPAADEPVTWVDPWPGVVAGGTSYYSGTKDPHPGANRLWRLVLVPRAELDGAVQERLNAGWMLVGTWATEAARVAAGRPRATLEVDGAAIPHEFDWLRTAVHLQKGCYRGQETVAKVHNVGRPPRRLTLLHLDGSSHMLPTPGAAVTLGDGDEARQVGHVTSVARHHELGSIGLALLKRSTPKDVPLAVTSDDEPIAASQDMLVDPSGESVDRPPPPGPTARGLLMGDQCSAPGGDLAG